MQQCNNAILLFCAPCSHTVLYQTNSYCLYSDKSNRKSLVFEENTSRLDLLAVLWNRSQSINMKEFMNHNSTRGNKKSNEINLIALILRKLIIIGKHSNTDRHNKILFCVQRGCAWPGMWFREKIAHIKSVTESKYRYWIRILVIEMLIILHYWQN